MKIVNTRRKINGNPAYLVRKPGIGTYLEFARSAGGGVYDPPSPHNFSVVIEEESDPIQRFFWDELPDKNAVVAAFGVVKRLGLIRRSVATFKWVSVPRDND